jgi:shikimate dehydrogenase
MNLPGMTASQPLISGATRLYGVLGWPVAHSLSPLMHNAAFAALGLDHIYVPLPVPPERLGDALRGLAALGFAGVNVTVPHKAAIITHLDDVSPRVRAIGSANTIVVRPDGTLWGDSTDGPGFLADLAAHGVDPAGQQVMLLGAGGAARGVAHALAEAGAVVAVLNRTLERAVALCKAIRAALPGARISAHPFPEALPGLAATANLIVNATSLGLHDSESAAWDPAVSFRSEQVVYDLVYTSRGARRALTPFLAWAAESGARTLDGLGMLIQQGARSFEIWTGQSAPVAVMQAALMGDSATQDSM